MQRPSRGTAKLCRPIVAGCQQNRPALLHRQGCQALLDVVEPSRQTEVSECQGATCAGLTWILRARGIYFEIVAMPAPPLSMRFSRTAVLFSVALRRALAAERVEHRVEQGMGPILFALYAADDRTMSELAASNAWTPSSDARSRHARPSSSRAASSAYTEGCASP